MRAMAAESHAQFEALVQQVGPAMLRYARRRTDPETAEDVVADALLVLWRRRSETPPDDATAWAIGVTRGCLANARRAARRQRNLAVRLAGFLTRATEGMPVSPDDGGIHEALATLNPKDRELLTLWAWDDLRPSEIALVMGLTAETVSVRLHRAKKRLARALPAERAQAQANTEQHPLRKLGKKPRR
jgi:RNA polymerase sigma-70 factor (ECF subfamily)